MPHHRRSGSRAPAALVAAALAVTIASVVGFVGAVVIAPPSSASAYRYWTYWHGAGSTWQFAVAGPASTVPPDGSVEGWSFGISTPAASTDMAPRVPADFGTICADTPERPGGKRVALVIDSGPSGIVPGDRPPPSSTVACVTAEPDATGYDILRSVAQVRVELGLVCGINGYPATECAPVLTDDEAASLRAIAATPPTGGVTTDLAPADSARESGASTAGSPPSPTGTSPAATVAVAVALIAGAAAWGWSRRRTGRRTSDESASPR